MSARLLKATTLAAVALFSVPGEAQSKEILLSSESNKNNDDDENGGCELWMAESSVFRDRLGVFSGIDRPKGASLGGSERVIPIYDANLNEWSLWQDYAWNNADIDGIRGHHGDLILQNLFESQAFVPGLASSLVCSKELASVSFPFRKRSRGGGGEEESSGVHRYTHSSAGSFSYRSLAPLRALQTIEEGQELFAWTCPTLQHTEEDDSEEQYFGFSDYLKQQMRKPLEMLEEEGICIDGLKIQPSTIEGAGKGAFAKRSFRRGQTIISSPVLHLDRSQLEIVHQLERKNKREIYYTEHVQHQNLLLNYCYGHTNSTVLFLPYGPGVSFINHHPTKANAILDWSESALMDVDLLEMSAHQLLHEDQKEDRLILDFVALREIEEGEEIFLNYGDEWEEAWRMHQETWKKAHADEHNSNGSYVSAIEYAQENFQTIEEQLKEGRFLLRTVDEQVLDPYPDNLMTACMFREDDEDEDDENNEGTEGIVWRRRHWGCLRPCSIKERHSYVTNNEMKSRISYTVDVHPIPNRRAEESCGLSDSSLRVRRIPASAVRILDKPYTSDQQMRNSFRHEIGVRSAMYPEHWMQENDYGSDQNAGNRENKDFWLPEEPLAPGQIEPIRWKSSYVDEEGDEIVSNDAGEVVTPNAYLLGLAPKIRRELLAYCDRMGITEYFRALTYRGNSLRPGEDEELILSSNGASDEKSKLTSSRWYVQRPESKWKSNMHWISPMDAVGHEDYLMALSAAGFDEVLQQVGEAFGMDGLAAYHVTFIGVSHCSQGYLHYDVSETGAKVFNIIIPLLLANQTGPELDVQQERLDDNDADNPVGRLRYQYNVASLMGDDAYHATSAVDYRVQKEMRMAATVYVADIHEDNVEAILKDYTQVYPPPGRPDVLLEMAGKHWKRGDPSVHLPRPPNHWNPNWNPSTAPQQEHPQGEIEKLSRRFKPSDIGL